MNVIKAVIFDLGGVYFTNGTKLVIPKFAKKENTPLRKIKQILRGKDSFILRKGLIKDKEFWDKQQKIVGDSFDVYKLRKIWYQSYTPDPKVVRIVNLLRKSSIKTVVFSGNIRSRIDFLEKKYSFRKNFDLEIYSFNLHLCKLDPTQREFIQKAAEIITDKLDLSPKNCVLIDDGDYIMEDAHKVGFKTILFDERLNLLNSLRQMGVKI